MHIHEQKRECPSIANETTFRRMTAKNKKQVMDEKTLARNVDKLLPGFVTF